MNKELDFGKDNIIVGDVEPPTRMYLQYIEKQASSIRQQAKIGPLERLYPRSLEKPFRIKFVSLEDMEADVSPEILEAFKSMSAKDWSGSGLEMPNDRLIVMLNPNQTVERENVTIMEEVSHKHWRHKPSQLIQLPGGFTKRVYNRAVEQQAYWTAAATLLPAFAIAQAIWTRDSMETIATKYGTSLELVKMRISLLGFWSEYLNNLQSVGNTGVA
jgi:hypothetical protein